MEVPGFKEEPLRLVLKQQVEAIEAEKLRQIKATAERQVRTQALTAMIEEAEATSQRLRVWVKAHLGPKNERLSEGAWPGSSPYRSDRPWPCATWTDPEQPQCYW